MIEGFLSPEPVVRLVKRFENAYPNFLATARTCYSSKGIVDESDIGDRWDFLAQSLYKAGHHTTLQHAHYQFALDRVSRHFLWSFLHSHPYYNSEQVSQRYVEVKPGAATVPPLQGKALEIYNAALESQMERYRSLCEKLAPLVENELHKRYPKRPLHLKKYKGAIKKKAQEAARYVLPVATHAFLYHTVSGVTLLRYYRLCKLFDTPLEQQIVIGKMVELLLQAEPKFKVILEEPLDENSIPEWNFFETFHNNGRYTREFLNEFDASLKGNVSTLAGYPSNNETLLADSVREVFGLPRAAMNDDEAIALALDPGRNRLLGESLNLTTVSKISRCMYHPSYTFRKKISHTADSQDQRHRMTPASRPILAGHLTGEPDYITPELIRRDNSVQQEYDGAMKRSWEAIEALRDLGVEEQFVQYLLPNAVSIRFTESSDLLNLRHKHAMRLCYNAQEEIWRASVDEAMQISEVNPCIGKYLLPPCTLRNMAKQKPICPEGDRFCGEKVWLYELDEYERVI